MPTSINKKIVGYKIATPSEPVLESMHEALLRPEKLVGATYKIKTPQSEHALYITINDMVLNAGTEQESYHPYEVFINSKNMDNFQWVIALTRVMSAVFRKGGEVGFLVDELKSVFDPKGGYYKKGGVFMNSLVAEIGQVIETHLYTTGAITKRVIEPEQKTYLESKAKEINGKFCQKCSNNSVVMLDGCQTCLECGDSKCG